MTSSSPEIAVVGAGVAGASAAYRLSELGFKSRVYETEDHPGGRMAATVINEAKFDHGAQFFTTRGHRFQSAVDAAAADGAVKVWTHGFDEPPDGYERWRGVPDMTALASRSTGRQSQTSKRLCNRPHPTGSCKPCARTAFRSRTTRKSSEQIKKRRI